MCLCLLLLLFSTRTVRLEQTEQQQQQQPLHVMNVLAAHWPALLLGTLHASNTSFTDSQSHSAHSERASTDTHQHTDGIQPTTHHRTLSHSYWWAGYKYGLFIVSDVSCYLDTAHTRRAHKIVYRISVLSFRRASFRRLCIFAALWFDFFASTKFTWHASLKAPQSS